MSKREAVDKQEHHDDDDDEDIMERMKLADKDIEMKEKLSGIFAPSHFQDRLLSNCSHSLFQSTKPPGQARRKR